MYELKSDPGTLDFLKSLGFPSVRIHHSLNHFDFTRASRRILVIGPMGSGKTEYSARVWRDARVARNKSGYIAACTTTDNADRRNVFFIRSMLDAGRFPDYPDDALAYRGGYEHCGNHIAKIRDSFHLEEVLRDHPEVGTWIIDEASFYDERLVYVVRNASRQRGLIFIFPALLLNFRRDIFNSTARLLLETATDVFPLTAYCEHPDCITDSFYTYRYYTVDGEECPALYFDPLIIIGGDKKKYDPLEPNYCTRCDVHHYLPGKEYTFFTLKPLGEQAARGDAEPLKKELQALKTHRDRSLLYQHLKGQFAGTPDEHVNMNSLRVANIAEKALIYLYAEQNLLPEELLIQLVDDLKLDRAYMKKTLADNHRQVDLDQHMLVDMF
jgi:thymidine kinase